MDAELAMRVARVIARRVEASSRRAEAEAAAPQGRKASHDQVLAAIPVLMSNLANAVGELNDLLSDAGIWVSMDRTSPSPLAEARFIFRLMNAEREEPHLDLTVDARGAIRAVLATETTRSLVQSATIFEADRARLEHMLLALPEAHYH